MLFPAFLFLIFVFDSSFASGPIHGSKGAAMGTAFSAIADDPSAIVSNPAGLIQLEGTNIYGGNSFVIPSTTFKGASGQEEETDFQIFFPPHAYVSSDFAGRDLRLGLGIYSLFGIGGRKWDRDGSLRYLSIKNQIATVNINPTVAYRVLPSLSAGFGVDLMYSRNEATRKVNQSLFGALDGDTNLKMDGWGLGVNAGILFTPDEKLSFGLAYRSRIKIRHKGRMDLNNIAVALQPSFGGSRFKTDVTNTMTFPDIFTLGAAYRPSKALTVTVEAEKMRWSSFRKAGIALDREVLEAGLTDISNDLGWKDIWILKAGAECKVNDKLALRGGYSYVGTPVPEKTLEPGNPDSRQHNISLGFGYKFDKIVIDFFYMAGFYANRKVGNAILSGSYDNFVHTTGISVGYRF